MKSLSLLAYNRGYSIGGMNESPAPQNIFVRKRRERNCLVWRADSLLFTDFLGIQKISQLCCEKSPIHISMVSLHSLKAMANHTTQTDFTEKTALIYTLNGLPRYDVLIQLVSFWCEITCGQHADILNGPKLCHSSDRSDCSSVCSQVTHRGWCFAAQESDRWKCIIRDFAVVATVKFFTLLRTLLENSD